MLWFAAVAWLFGAVLMTWLIWPFHKVWREVGWVKGDRDPYIGIFLFVYYGGVMAIGTCIIGTLVCGAVALMT